MPTIKVKGRMAQANGKWHRRDDVVEGVSKEEAEALVALGAAEVVAGEVLPVVIEVDGQEVDLSTINDADKLRDIAKTIGLEIPGNVKKVDTLIERIVAHKATEEAGSDG